ncbi:alpha/beta hydrolase family esterase [Alteribacillus iranensis]|uniref:Polyhydroxybutyrate depolymerase n=1 Tax=Alteribacillus iranensis TaxID=930128 RepID=A0A1I2DRB0_9BACI|nr:PHB depolymerase family esterase [Alteribacillus iranensis]SFE82440.1 polyhydroxybutyrate depolymerase [Alteribacillus iranensis]
MKKGKVSKETIVVQGQERSFLYYIPTSYKGSAPIPLLLSFHGAASDASYHSRLTTFHHLAEEENFFVLYPESTKLDPSNPSSKQWNEGVSGNPAKEANVNDIEFIKQLIEQWKQLYYVDKGKIFTTGFSNGSGFSLRLAIDLPNTFAGIGVVSGPLPLAFSDKVEDMPPLVFMMGTDDPIIPYSAAHAAGEHQYAIYELLGAQKTAEAFAYGSYEVTQVVTERLPTKVLEDATRVDCIRFNDHAGRSPVTFYSIKGGGHTWPGGPKLQPPAFNGPVSQQIDATRVIWDHFNEQTNEKGSHRTVTSRKTY